MNRLRSKHLVRQCVVGIGGDLDPGSKQNSLNLDGRYLTGRKDCDDTPAGVCI